MDLNLKSRLREATVSWKILFSEYVNEAGPSETQEYNQESPYSWSSPSAYPITNVTAAYSSATDNVSIGQNPTASAPPEPFSSPVPAPTYGWSSVGGDATAMSNPEPPPPTYSEATNW